MCSLSLSLSPYQLHSHWKMQGSVVSILEGHGHWVNTMALNTDTVLRTGAYDHNDPPVFTSPEEAIPLALARYQSMLSTSGGGGERLVTGSDDFTLYLWQPSASTKPLVRMTGHQQLVNHVAFSPDARLIASGSFDKSVRLWDAQSGKFIRAFRNHVGAVYQVCWSADSRLVLSASRDSTVKVYDVRAGKLREDLPGHEDEVYAVDWSADGQRVASGGKDRMLKLWRH